MENFFIALYGLFAIFVVLIIFVGIPIALFRWLWRKGDK